MRWFASLILMIALSFNTPNVCAHALGTDERPATSQEMMRSMADHADMTHDMSHVNHEIPDGHSNHCPDGCVGGEGCQGCSAIPSAILFSHDFGLPTVPEAPKTQAISLILKTSLLLDPPPPKHLS